MRQLRGITSNESLGTDNSPFVHDRNQNIQHDQSDECRDGNVQNPCEHRFVKVARIKRPNQNLEDGEITRRWFDTEWALIRSVVCVASVFVAGINDVKQISVSKNGHQQYKNKQKSIVKDLYDREIITGQLPVENLKEPYQSHPEKAQRQRPQINHKPRHLFCVLFVLTKQNVRREDDQEAGRVEPSPCFHQIFVIHLPGCARKRHAHFKRFQKEQAQARKTKCSPDCEFSESIQKRRR